MKKFNYEVINVQGNLIKGEIESPSKEDAEKSLKEDGFYVKSLTKKFNFNFQTKVDSKTKGNFFYKLHNIMKSGVDLIRGLELISLQMKNKKFQEIILKVIEKLKEGESLSDCLEQHPKVFSNMVVQQVRAGEIGSNIDEIFLDIYHQYESEDRIKKSISSALAYPAMIIVMGIIIVFVMINNVIPVLQDAFNSVDAELPGLTLFVLSISDNIIKYAIGLVSFIVISFLIYQYIKRDDNLKYKFDKHMLKVPLIGKGIYFFQTNMFFKILGSLISIGMPVTEVFEILKNTISNKYILKGVVESKDSIERDGLSLSDVLTKSGVFHEEYVQLILIGEETGDLPDMLNFMSEQSQGELDLVLKKFTTMVSPLILIGVLAVVGFILIAMMLPVFTLMENI